MGQLAGLLELQARLERLVYAKKLKDAEILLAAHGHPVEGLQEAQRLLSQSMLTQRSYDLTVPPVIRPPGLKNIKVKER